MPEITDRARHLRNNLTEAEKRLWSRLKHRQLGHKIRRQHPISPYIVDFYCPDYGLIIEIDGGQHAQNNNDLKRSAFLEAKGYHIIRFWNNEVLENLEGVLQAIELKIKSLPIQSPPPAGRGGKGGRDDTLSFPSRRDFPVLAQTMNGEPLVYLDTAASAQKPQSVIDAMNGVYETGYSNIHRGLYSISQRLTTNFEAVRTKVARFIGAESAKNIVFTRNATEGVNLVAQSWGRTFLKASDEIILTEMEHHANIVPWQLLRDQIGIVIKTIPVDERGLLDLSAYKSLLSPRTKLIAFTHVSNALGTVNPAAEIVKTARAQGGDIKILIDGAQAVVHGRVDVTALDADFYVFTGHKLYGPTGIGVLYGRYGLLQSMPPYQGGGDMIERVSFENTTYKLAPYKFEAGTPAIVEVIGLGAAIDYMEQIGRERIVAHERALLEEATKRMAAVPGLKIWGPPPADKAAIISFTMDGAHPSDIGMVMDQCGIAIRTGHHCCMPLMKRLGLDATARISFGLYSNRDDIDSLIAALHKVRELFA